jgi:hypothetical protein
MDFDATMMKWSFVSLTMVHNTDLVACVVNVTRSILNTHESAPYERIT